MAYHEPPVYSYPICSTSKICAEQYWEAVLKGRLQVCMSIKYIELKTSMDLLGATQALGKTICHC